uniref:Uncharacterized protein n=1 Tax=Ananas comosus var. bracteatus TaxID=296719 RepID=A0A6V7PQQ7_ANACO|nr:unnamed protein product [Ananas comosus var. bracteatus]
MCFGVESARANRQNLDSADFALGDRSLERRTGPIGWACGVAWCNRSRQVYMEITVTPGPIPIWAGPSTSNRRRTDRVSPIRPRLITCTNSNKKCTSGNIQKRLTRG